MTRAGWLWLVLVVPLWGVLIACTHWEPVMHDSWTHQLWHFWHDVTPSSISEFVSSSWQHENPRFGQLVTLLLFTPGPWHPIVTPVVELGVFVLLTTLALGRWPSVRRADDALVFAMITAIVLLCAPQIGPMLFYRPFTGNYVYGLALNLLLLVPYRLHAEAARAWGAWLAPPLLVLGLVAGMCNEHTGAAVIGAIAVAIAVTLRREAPIRAWMIAGLVGLVAGYLLLLLAPGQDVRYDGLATHAGMLKRIAERGTANIWVIWPLPRALAPALPWLLLGVIARRTSAPAPVSAATRLSWLVLAAAGVACTLTLLASPKIGPRLYLASVALCTTALAGWIGAQLTSPWSRRVCAALSLGAIAFVAIRCVMIYAVIGPINAQRLAIIRKGPIATVVVIPRFPVPASRYFLGEDLDPQAARTALAVDYGLYGIDLEPAR